MIKVTPYSCCGCTACVAVCSHNAISMKPDALGFLYPEVNEDLCINCGLCEKVCPFDGKNIESYSTPNSAFAVRHLSINEVEKSRSGAAFVALSDWILSQGGVIYGAGYTEHFRVAHKRAVTREERDVFRGSKYTQSDMNNIFSCVKKDLRNGILVLFSGTPCQTAGLKSFLGRLSHSDNLFLIDIICHGVASPFLWRDYLTYLESKEKDSIDCLSFRDKQIFGWSGLHKESFTFTNKGKKTYTYTFYNDIMIRKSCNYCPFTTLKRSSDITLGDFWGIEKFSPNFNIDDKGVSLVFCNTKKGLSLFSNVKDNVQSIKVDIKDCMQPNLERPTPIHVKRFRFEEDYVKYGFKYVMNKYGNIGFKFQVRRIIRFILRKFNRFKK